MPCNQRIAVDGMVMVPVDEWNQISSNYNRLLEALEGMVYFLRHEGCPEIKEARAAIKEARKI